MLATFWGTSHAVTCHALDWRGWRVSWKQVYGTVMWVVWRQSAGALLGEDQNQNNQILSTPASLRSPVFCPNETRLDIVPHLPAGQARPHWTPLTPLQSWQPCTAQLRDSLSWGEDRCPPHGRSYRWRGGTGQEERSRRPSPWWLSNSITVEQLIKIFRSKMHSKRFTNWSNCTVFKIRAASLFVFCYQEKYISVCLRRYGDYS